MLIILLQECHWLNQALNINSHITAIKHQCLFSGCESCIPLWSGLEWARCSFCSKRLFAKATEVSVRLNMKLISVEFYQPFLPPNTRCEEHVQMRAEHNEAGGQLGREIRKDSKRSTMLREERWREAGRKEGREHWRLSVSPGTPWQFHMAYHISQYSKSGDLS